MLADPDPAAVRARSRRQALMLLALVNALVLGIGLVAVVDLRRLQTPGGTALRWVEAAVFGNCPDYFAFSVPAGDVPDGRTDAAVCRALTAATGQARNDQLRIGLRLGPVVRRGQRATAEVLLTRDGKPQPLHVSLVRRHGHWRVLRDAATCESVGCP